MSRNHRNRTKIRVDIRVDRPCFFVFAIPILSLYLQWISGAELPLNARVHYCGFG